MSKGTTHLLYPVLFATLALTCVLAMFVGAVHVPAGEMLESSVIR